VSTDDAVARRKLSLPSDQDASGRSFGASELEALAEVIASGTLTSTKGKHVARLEQAVADRLGVAHAIATSSGTSAIHAAVAAIDPEPGDEIITTAVTDMGGLAPLLYQGAIPVFADIDPRSLLVTPESVEAVWSERTRAVIVTHLFGAPCDLVAFRALCDRRGVALIEDAAQAWLTESAGRLAGTVGDLGCFSLQQGKHLTTGEGGVVVTNDAAMARRVRLWVNKAWPYGEVGPDHEFLALNARLSELQGAVGHAQFAKLDDMVAARCVSAAVASTGLASIAGLEVPLVRADDRHTYWKFALDVDADLLPGGPTGLATELRLDGVQSAPRYIQKPAFATRVFAEQRTFGSSRWPFTVARPEAVDYDPSRFPGTYRGLERVLVLPWNERYGTEHAQAVVAAVASACDRLRGTA
jgi:perosamine synthetase